MDAERPLLVKWNARVIGPTAMEEIMSLNS